MFTFPHPTSNCFSQSRRRSTAAAGNLGTALPTKVFHASTCGYTSKIIEHPPHCRATIPRPELCRHLSFATRAPPSPELYLSSGLRLDLPQTQPSILCPNLHSPLACKAPLFLATTTGSVVVATVSADQLGHISPTSPATAPIDLPLQTKTNGKAPSSWPLPPTPASPLPSAPTN